MRAQGHPHDRRCPGTDPLAQHTSSLPFLPTLVTAIALGGLGLLCRQPASPDPVVPPLAVAEAQIDGFRLPAPLAMTEKAVPGIVAFGQQYPLSGVIGVGRPAHVATNIRRRCVAGHCETGRAETVRSAASPVRALDPVATSSIPMPTREAERGNGLPGGALPFAPSAAAMLDGVRMIGNRAMTLGGSVVGVFAELE